MKSGLFPGLSDISFAERDTATVEAAVIGKYEEVAGRALAKGDPVRLFLEAVAFIIVHQRTLIDYAAKQNLLAYADGEYLEHLGALLGVSRIPASHALTTLRFTLSAPQPGAVVIPAGTRATPGGGTLFFASDEELLIPAGEVSGTVSARCTQVGGVGNGFAVGAINKIVDPFPWEMSVANETESSGGGEREGDEHFRQRIQLAPESFSVAGPRGAYEYWARSAHQGIIDVAVVGPPELDPGYVELYPLMEGGALPSQDIMDLVFETCNAEDVRPLTDCVSVKAPNLVNYTLAARYWVDNANATVADGIQAAVEAAARDWVTWQRSKLGRDINPSELVKRMVTAGAKRVVVDEPVFTVLEASQLAVPIAQSVSFGGLEDG